MIELLNEALRVIETMEGQKFSTMPTNPTAENMAEYLRRIVCPMLFGESGIVVSKVIIWETENCFAESTE